MMPGGPEVLIVLAVVLLLFGARRIPELARSLGSGAREFRKGISGEEADREAEREELAEGEEHELARSASVAADGKE